MARKLCPYIGMFGLLCAVIGCPSTTPPPNGGENPVLPALFDTQIPPFAVIVSADRITGIPATVFNLSVEVHDTNAAIRTISWRVNNADDLAQGLHPQFTFSQPGDYLIDVVVTDEQGAVVTDGILIKVFDPAAQPATPASQITPAAGMPGTFVQIHSVELNKPAARIQVMVGSGVPFEPFRPELGTANFLIPFHAADGINAATTTQITLLTDGQVSESFNFVLSPAAVLVDAPGALVRRWLDAGPGLLDTAENDLITILTRLNAGLAPEEQAMMQALLRFARGRFEQVRDVLTPVIDTLDSENLTAFDRVLMANGVDVTLLESTLQAKTAVSNKNANDDLIDLLCKFHDVMKAVQDFINAAGHAANVLPLLALETAGTAITPTIVAMANIISELDLVGDVLKEIDELVPHVESLEVTATPNALKTESEKAVIHVNAKLTLQNDICRDTVDKLIDEISSRSIQRLIQIVPLPRLARIVIRHSFVLGEAGRIEALHEMQDFLRSSMNTIAGLIISVGQLDGILAQIHVKLCAIEQRDSLPLQPADPTMMTTSPPTAGTFLNLQEESLDFYCRLGTQGQVSIKAERECGLADASGNVHKLNGEVHVTCFAELCTENALGSLTINPVLQPTLTRSSPCGFVKEQLETQLVDVFFTNTHPERTIALATVSILESDQQQLPRGPCEDPKAFGGSVVDCLDRSTAGCDSPPGLFLMPGQTTLIPATFICRREDLYPPEGGICGDLKLETTKGHLLVQAVFCDDFETAQANFCRNVDQQMKLLGFPAPEFPSTEVRPCP